MALMARRSEIHDSIHHRQDGLRCENENLTGKMVLRHGLDACAAGNPAATNSAMRRIRSPVWRKNMV